MGAPDSTLLNLEQPFKSKWKRAYLQTHKSGRKYVCLYNSREDRTIIAYARYLICVKENRLLTNEEVVDHIDEDYTNDNLTNLQIISKVENNIKAIISSGRSKKFLSAICPVCKNPFTKAANSLRFKLKQGKTPCCSRSCGAKYGFTQR